MPSGNEERIRGINGARALLGIQSLINRPGGPSPQVAAHMHRLIAETMKPDLNQKKPK